MERTKIARRTTASVAASFVGLLMLAGPVSADPYSDAKDNTTEQERDTGSTDPGTTNDAAVGQVDDDLAFTGSDARSLALVGVAVAGAGALLVVTSRRRNAELP